MSCNSQCACSWKDNVLRLSFKSQHLLLYLPISLQYCAVKGWFEKQVSVGVRFPSLCQADGWAELGVVNTLLVAHNHTFLTVTLFASVEQAMYSQLLPFIYVKDIRNCEQAGSYLKCPHCHTNTDVPEPQPTTLTLIGLWTVSFLFIFPWVQWFFITISHIIK